MRHLKQNGETKMTTITKSGAMEMKIGENEARVALVNDSVVMSFYSHGAKLQTSVVLSTTQAEELASMLTLSVRDEKEPIHTCCSMPTQGEFGECITCGAKW
jgi:hypothetical protein